MNLKWSSTIDSHIAGKYGHEFHDIDLFSNLDSLISKLGYALNSGTYYILWWVSNGLLRPLAFQASTHDRFVRHQLDRRYMPRKSIEQHAATARLAAVEAEAEFVQIAVQMMDSDLGIKPRFETQADLDGIPPPSSNTSYCGHLNQVHTPVSKYEFSVGISPLASDLGADSGLHPAVTSPRRPFG